MGPVTGRADLKAFMDGLRGECFAGNPSIEARLSAKIDEVILEIARDRGMSQSFALLAIGGYGRRVLHPHSDIDLLFFFKDQVDENLAKAFLHPLWDLGLKVSQQVRTSADFANFDDAFIPSYTAFLDGRFLAGEERAADEFTGLLTGFLSSHRDRFLKSLVEMKRSRYADFGETVFQLEPDLKDAPGGVRDAHWSSWVQRVLRPPVGALYERPGRSQTAPTALALHHQLRTFLHFQSGRNQNVLEYEYQEMVASQMNYRDSVHGEAAENLMRDYFLKASEIARLASFWEEEIVGSPNSVAVSSDFSDPFEMVDAFAKAHRAKARLDSATLVAIRQKLIHMNGVLADNPRAGRVVLDMMKDREGIYDTLISMHDVGLLGKIFPDFEEIRCRVIRDFFHKYTVDEHSLIAIRNIEQLPASSRFALLLQELPHPELLLLSLLFHDIGKAHRHDQGNHVHPSTEGVRRILEKLEMPRHELERVVFAVKNHLEMSKIVLRRDFSDDQVIEQFADLVGDLDNLRLLSLLTYADMRAVNNEVMTPWKEDLLWQLYVETHNRLTLGLADDTYSQQPSLEADIDEIVKIVSPDASPREVREFLDGFPRRYLKNTPKAQIARHFLLSRRLESRPMVMHLNHSGSIHELLVMTPDRPFLFAKITGVLSYFGMNIVRGQAFANRREIIFDLIAFEDPDDLFNKTPSERDRFEMTLNRVIHGELELNDLLRGKFTSIIFQQQKKSLIPTTIHFDDEFSSRCTIMEILTQDAFGLLYRIANVVSSHGCNIDVAIISTEGHRATDVFYLTIDGRKLTPDLERVLGQDLIEEIRGSA